MATLSTEPHAVTLQAVDWPGVEPLSAQESTASQPVECDTVETYLRVQQSLMQPGLQAPSNNPTASRKEKLAAPRASNVSRVEALNGAIGKAIAPTDAIRDQHHNTPNSVRPRKVIGVDESKTPSITIHDSDQREPAQHRVLKQELPKIGRYVLVSSQDADSDTKFNDAVHFPFTTTSPPVSTEGLPTTAVQPSNTLKLDGNATKFFPGKKSIPFDERYCDSLGHGIFLDRRDVPDQALLEAWNQRVLGDLDKCVQSFWRNKLTGSGILPTNEFKMVGKKHKDELFAEPTIVITCPTKEDQRKVKRFLRKLKPRFLESFKAKVRVEYTRTGGTVYAALSESSTSTARHKLGDLKTLSIEGHNKQSTNCGLKLRFETSQRGVERRSYATLGGVIAIGETLYGITTAHTFLADLQKQAPSAVSFLFDDTDDSSHVTTSDPNTDTDTDTDISAAMESIYPSSVEALHFETLYNSLRLQSRMVWSFQGQVLGTDHTVESTFKISDWVVFAIGHTLTLPNLHKSQELLSFIPEPELTPGEVSVLCEVDGCYNGFLTLSNASVHTKNGAMNVREVLLDSPLPLGSSGAWIIRGNRTCGYVVAITRRGLSCFMVPIERAFQEIEIVFGKKVNLRQESETVDFGPKFERPTAEDRIEVHSPSSPVPSGQFPTEKAESSTSFVEEPDRIHSAEHDMPQENPEDGETEAKGGHAETANQNDMNDFVFPEIYRRNRASAEEYIMFFDKVNHLTVRCGAAASDMLHPVNYARRSFSLTKAFSISTIAMRKLAFPRLAFNSIVQHLGTIQLTWAQIGEYLHKYSLVTKEFYVTKELFETLTKSLTCLLYALDIIDEFVRLNSKSRRTMTQSLKRMSMAYNLPEVQKHFKGLACNAESLRKLVMV